MAGALVITCAMTTIEVEHGTCRECPFTLCNRADGELRVQLRLLALDATAQGWLAIGPQDTIELSPGETRQVSVSVHPQASGRFAFRLDAIPMAAPGERTIGPSVDLVVASRTAPGAPRRGRPWLAVAVALLALALFALVLAFALDRAAIPHPHACAPARGLDVSGVLVACPFPAPAARMPAATPGSWPEDRDHEAAPMLVLAHGYRTSRPEPPAGGPVPEPRPSPRSSPCPMN